MTQKAIALFTDFGVTDPYVGQMHAAIRMRASTPPIIDLHHYSPAFAPDPAGLLLESLLPYLASGTVVIGVVDPGVGTARQALAVSARGLWLVGPDNGLFSPLIDSDEDAECFRLRPPDIGRASATFHGRDIFAPVGAELARENEEVLGGPVSDPVRIAPQRDRIIYVDHYGNLFTGLPVPPRPEKQRLRIAGQDLGFARTFGDVEPGELFWYRNSLGRVEVAARERSAASLLGVQEPGAPVDWGEG